MVWISACDIVYLLRRLRLFFLIQLLVVTLVSQ